MIRWRLDGFCMQELVSLSRDDDPLSLFSQGPDDAERQVDEALSGRHRSIREGFRERLGTRRTRFDATSARLIAHAGIDPLCLCVIAGKTDVFGVLTPDAADEDDYIVYVETESGVKDGFIRLAPGVTWRFQGGLTLTGLPETALALLESRTLGEIVRHPVLDADARRVVGIRREVFGDATYVHVDVAPTCANATPDELLDIEIRNQEAA